MSTKTTNHTLKNKVVPALPFIAVAVAMFAVMFFFGTHLKHLAVTAFGGTSQSYESNSSTTAFYDASEQVAVAKTDPGTGACLCPLCCSAPTE